MSEITILKRAAEQKLSMNAQYLMGLMFLYGQDEQGTAKDIPAAGEWFAKAAAQNHRLAEERLRRLNAPQPEKDTPERLQQAAGQGDKHAQYDLAQMHYYGWACKQDFAQCAKWAQQAAAQHCPYAQYLLSGLYFDGKRVREVYPYAWYVLDEQHFDEHCIEKSYRQAFEWMLKSAEQGYVHAQNFLGDVMYDCGIGVEKNAVKAFTWVHKAALQGYAEAQHALGLLHYHGSGCEQSNAQARQWYHKAAAQGHANAIGRIGDMCRVYDNNERQAFIWSLKAAELGNASAQNAVAEMLEHADDIPHDHAKACYWYQKAAEQGWVTAAMSLAEHYARGHGVPHDETEAAYWYLHAAKLGYDQAQYQIGLRYEEGSGIDKDFKQAEYWYRLGAKQNHYHCKQKVESIRITKRYLKAAKKGEADAETLCKLGGRLVTGLGCAPDEAQAQHWFLAAVERGHARAAYSLGQMYEDGQGVEKNQTQAFTWYQKAVELGDENAQKKLDKLEAVAQQEAAIQRNDPDAHYQLARNYDWGEGGLPRDSEKALAHYLCAAAQGHAGGARGVAEIHLFADDYAQSLNWYKKSAQLGDDHAHYVIGMFYDPSIEGDWGVASDAKKAMFWYEQAAQRGNLTAQLLLGKRLSEGQGMPKDDAGALYWYEKAAAQGNAEAQSLLGDWYAQGRGTARDETKAIHWYEQASAQGERKARDNLKHIQARLALANSGEDDIEIRYRLGLDYDYGRGVKRDFVKAVQYYRSAAERGHADAQFEMGNMCAFAQGTQHNQPEALDWYIKAALQGHEGAKRQIRGIQKIQKIAEAAVQGDVDAQCIIHDNQAIGSDDPSSPAEAEPPTRPKAATPQKSPLWYTAAQIPLLEKALAAEPSVMPAPIRAIQQKTLDIVIRCAEKLSGAFADKHVELVKLGMRALRKEANDYDMPDEFTLETPMFEELSAQLRKVRDAEGAFALHCMVDRSKYKIYECDVANNFAITVHCNAYDNLNWMDDRYSDETHPAVLKGTPTAAALGFDNDFVVGGHQATWAAAAPIRNSQGKIIAIVEAHLLAPELRNQLQWNASSPACGR